MNDFARRTRQPCFTLRVFRPVADAAPRNKTEARKTDEPSNWTWNRRSSDEERVLRAVQVGEGFRVQQATIGREHSLGNLPVNRRQWIQAANLL